MLSVALALLLVSQTGFPARHDASAPTTDRTRPRVRPLDDPARTIVSIGERSSATVEQLLAALERSDVVVYVQTAARLGAPGVLTFVAHGEPLTYVLIRVELDQSPRDRIAMLAHELTHALEVAEAQPPIRSEADLVALYRTVGFRGRSARDFESARARANERQARGEQDRVSAAPKARPGG
jgi:hypothetical protein